MSWRALVGDIVENDGAPPFDRRTVTVLVATPLLLVAYYYFARVEYVLPAFMAWSTEELGRDWPYHGLAAYAVSGAASVVIRVVVPLLLIIYVLRDSPREYGFRLRGTLEHTHIYGLLFLLVLPFVYWASLQESFLATYPFYRPALAGGWQLWAYELTYLVQFFAIEAFFRGFIIFGLRPRFGYYSVLVMVIPYCMIHFGKPLAEALGAIVAGAVLGVLALRTGSFYLGVALHCAVALLMDLLAVYGMAG